MQDLNSTQTRRHEVAITGNFRHRPRASIAIRLSRIILGKLRKLFRLRVQRGIPVDPHGWARVIVSQLSEFCAADVIFWGRWIGFEILPGIAHAVVAEVAAITGQRTLTLRRGPRLSPRERGDRLQLTAAERDAVGFWQAHAIDETPEAGRKRRARERAATAMGACILQERQFRKRDRDRKRSETKRRANGCKPRADYEVNSISARKPWIAAGFRTRRTWERHGKPERLPRVASPPPVSQVRRKGA